MHKNKISSTLYFSLKRGKTIMRKLLMSLFVILGFFVTIGNIHAASLNPNDYITKVTLTDANGAPVSSPVQSGSVIGIDVQWASSNSHPIKSGDTLTIPLTVSNSNINISTYTKQGALVTSDGTNIGRYSIQNGKITMNFDDGVSALMQNSIKGEVKLKAMVTMNSSARSSASTNVNVGSQTVTVTAQKPATSGSGVVITDISKPQISKNGLKEQSD